MIPNIISWDLLEPKLGALACVYESYLAPSALARQLARFPLIGRSSLTHHRILSINTNTLEERGQTQDQEQKLTQNKDQDQAQDQEQDQEQARLHDLDKDQEQDHGRVQKQNQE